MSSPSERELLETARSGDKAAVRALLERYAPSVFRFGMKMCRDRSDAEDVLQETLLAAARGLGAKDDDAAMTSWLFAIARSFCIKKRRRSKYAPRAIESLDEGTSVQVTGEGPEEHLARIELTRALEAAIGALDPKSREVLVLRDVEGLSATEVAGAMALSVEAVKSRLHRARGDLRAKLLPAIGGEERPSKPTPKCGKVVRTFSRYLEGEITGEACATMKAHVDGCASCSAACDSLRRALALCHSAGAAPLPPDVETRLREALNAVLT